MRTRGARGTARAAALTPCSPLSPRQPLANPRPGVAGTLERTVLQSFAHEDSPRHILCRVFHNARAAAYAGGDAGGGVGDADSEDEGPAPEDPGPDAGARDPGAFRLAPRV